MLSEAAAAFCRSVWKSNLTSADQKSWTRPKLLPPSTSLFLKLPPASGSKNLLFHFLQIDQLLQFYRPRCKKSQTKTSGRIAAMEFPVLWLKILGTLAMQLVSISPSTSQVGKFIILSWQRNPGEVNESFLPPPQSRQEWKEVLAPTLRCATKFFQDRNQL